MKNSVFLYTCHHPEPSLLVVTGRQHCFLKYTTHTSYLHIGSCSVTLMQVITFQEGSKWIVQQEAAGNVYQSFPRTVVDVLGETRNLQQSLLFVPEKMLFSGGDQAPD